MFFTTWHNFRSDFWPIFTFLLRTSARVHGKAKDSVRIRYDY